MSYQHSDHYKHFFLSQSTYMKSQVLLVNKQNNVLMADKTTVSLADDNGRKVTVMSLEVDTKSLS